MVGYFHRKNKNTVFLSDLDSSFNRVLPSTSNNRKRQLPDIPVAQLHAKREEGIKKLIFCFSRFNFSFFSFFFDI